MNDRTQRNGADVEERERSRRFKKVFGTVTGKEVLNDLLEHCGIDRPIFSKDVRVQEKRVALNDFGLWILEQVNGKQKGEKDEVDD